MLHVLLLVSLIQMAEYRHLGIHCTRVSVALLMARVSRQPSLPGGMLLPSPSIWGLKLSLLLWPNLQTVLFGPGPQSGGCRMVEWEGGEEPNMPGENKLRLPLDMVSHLHTNARSICTKARLSPAAEGLSLGWEWYHLPSLRWWVRVQREKPL